MKAGRLRRGILAAFTTILMASALLLAGCSPDDGIKSEAGELSIGKDIDREDSLAAPKDGGISSELTQEDDNGDESSDSGNEALEEKADSKDPSIEISIEGQDEDNDDPLEADKTTGEDKEIDLIFFMGQSNMSGCGGDASLAPAVTAGAGYEFRAVSDPFSLHDIKEPFGFAEFVIGGICDTIDGKKGSMVSSFVNEYYLRTGHTVVAVSASAGATTTEDWLSDGFVTDLSVRVKNAQDYLNNNGYTINNQYVVWLQGESDALEKVHSDEYKTNMDNIIRPLFIEGFTKVFVITPGRTLSNKNFFNEIIDAQLDMCKNSGYYALASTMLCTVSTDYMVDEWHYNQKVLNLLGEEAAKAVAYYTNEDKEMCIYDYKHDTTFIPEFFGYDEEVTVSPEDINTILANR